MPFKLPPNQPDRFYQGGVAIGTFRSLPPVGSHTPEDWIGSTTCCFGAHSVGLSTHPLTGRLLVDEIATSPDHYLGPAHVAAHGADTKILLKLLDAGQRLPVHAHPHRDWAHRHLGRGHGKAEAWYILTPGVVYLGLTEDVDQATLLRWVEGQHVDEMLSRMHRVEVAAHDTVYVPPGMLHAIGGGILLVEVQEPEDLSILLDWTGFALDGPRDGHLGLGFPTALTGVEAKGRTPDEISRLVVRGVGGAGAGAEGEVFATPSREYFGMEKVRVRGERMVRQGFGIVVVLDGEVDFGGVRAVKGENVLVAFADGEVMLRGDAEVLIARPPE